MHRSPRRGGAHILERISAFVNWVGRAPEGHYGESYSKYGCTGVLRGHVRDERHRFEIHLLNSFLPFFLNFSQDLSASSLRLGYPQAGL